MKFTLASATLLMVTFATWSSAQESAEPQIDFATQIQPLLSDRCFFCHGPDQRLRKANLRLDDEASAKDFSISPGDPDDSELLSRVLSGDPEEMMPPPHSKLPKFTDGEVELIRKWIEQGARWGKHWAFELPQKAPLPDSGLVFNDFDSDWIRNPIDAFVLKKLESEGVKPSRRADRNTLLRRLSFDLTGLPPALGDLKNFRQAENFDEALSFHIDRLLASSHYGERMASDWLDVARYSDTYGYQVDRDRRVWPWRDWVIKAFNENKPYDEFAREQLAGDLLPNANDEQILATTFNRLHPQKVEGGSVEEEFRIEYVADRTQTFSTAFLGLTMECARCHDHKYDPLSQQEFYELSAFFDNIDEAGLYSYFTGSTPTPTLDLPSEKQRQDLAQAKAKVDESLAAFDKVSTSEKLQDEFEAWYKDFDGQVETKPLLHEAFEAVDGKLGGGNKSAEGRVGKSVLLTGDDAFNTKVGNFPRHQPFSISFWMNPPETMKRAVVLHRSRAWTDAASRGYQVLIEEGKLSWSLVHFWPGNALRVKTLQTILANEWTHVTVTYDGSSKANGARVFLNGQAVETEVVRDHLTREIIGGGGDHIAIGERFRDFGFKGGRVDELRVFDVALTQLEVASVYAQDGGDASVSTNDKRIAFEHFSQRVSETTMKLTAKSRAASQTLNQLRSGIPQIMVMRETEATRSTYLLARGAYDQPSDEVQPMTPRVLSEFEAKFARNRLGLANWLVDRGNPLTARVYVNRVWQLLMGQGLVRTPEDFGVQGQAPTHPELLDWLAIDFMENGWDVKRLVKQIVTSSTYLQSSAPRADLLERDPENRFLARHSRTRLSAEMLRDNVLVMGGLLSKRSGGAPSKPYDIEASFKPAARSKGEGLYRRSLYTYWRRTAPAPMMMTLDAAKRDVCQVKRESTSSPLQAFVLMNSPQFVEAARGLAESLAEKHPNDNSLLLSEMFELLTSRPITEAELKVLGKLLDGQLSKFENAPEAAQKYLAVGDKPATLADSPRLAAVCVVANTLLGYHDAVMKR
jgi:hypothetical protein